MSLMLVSKLNEPMCCPTLLPSGAPASLKLVASRHPCVAETFSGDDFVPNDVTIGADGAPSSLLLTGFVMHLSLLEADACVWAPVFFHLWQYFLRLVLLVVD